MGGWWWLQKEVIATILSYVEAKHKLIRVLPRTSSGPFMEVQCLNGDTNSSRNPAESSTQGHVTFFKTQPAELAATSPLIANILEQGGKRGVSSGKYGFSVIKVR